MIPSTLRTVQHLARTGDTEQAWRLFESSGIAQVVDNADVLSVKGRLTKDRALKALGEERATLFGEARSAYLSAAALRPATYPLINAATIALFAGHRAEAEQTAGQILEMLESGAHEPETDYWLKATRAEAYLLQGRVDDAREALAQAIRAAPSAWEDHASTLRQFRLILDWLKAPSDWLDALRPPPSLHFSGIIHLPSDRDGVEREIEASLAELAPGFGFGALAAGADIITAETLVRAGGELHIVLPAPIDVFRRDSVGVFGSPWIARFDRLLDEAATVEVGPDIDDVSEAGIFLADQMAMGLAIRHARILETRTCALRVGTVTSDRNAARQLDAAWEAQGLPIHRLDISRSTTNRDTIPALANSAFLAVTSQAAADALVGAGGVIVDQREQPIVVRFLDPVNAVRAAWDVAADHNVAIAIDYVVFDPSSAYQDHHDRIRLIARAAPSGRVLLSRAMALVLTLQTSEFGNENFGEIATAHGDIALHILTMR
ncbi:TRAFs-binding domain-containing protein [Sphingomonas crocodyli]|uniref:DUF4071 domain-containing protein n=1 Tax=Sphingomonas crocodyli TaxID=1979270 RepID=A0A437LXV1_9SPHN|nr:TRAFs-binding domain-containing protein [Sphingomonas crocodyli]RVT90230.1 DUF4071 domain-containing protein [Sphingomonas crocodyli]